LDNICRHSTCCNLDVQPTGSNLSNLLLEEFNACADVQDNSEIIEDLSLDKDDEVLASDIVLAEDDEVPKGDHEEIVPNKDEVFVLQEIAEKNMSERTEGNMGADSGLDEVVSYGNYMGENEYLLDQSFTPLLG